MLGFTGFYGEKRVSVMGSGMGMPSLSIYVNELIREYDVKSIIRVGTCGGLQPHLKVGDLVIAMTSSTNSQINKNRFGGMDFAPCADFDLLHAAYNEAIKITDRVFVGGNLASDSFYQDDPEWWKLWADYGSLVVEMETTELYTLAAKYRVKALSILTVSDNLVTGDDSSSDDRERGFPKMAKIALDII